MLFVPLPFVVALLLFILLIQMIRRQDEGGAHPFFLAWLTVAAVQSVVIGVRWGYDIVEILPLQAILAAAAPTLAWLSFDSLRTERPPSQRPYLLLHLIPTLLVAGFVAFWPDPISLTIILIFLGYGAALVRLAWAGPNVLGASRLDGVITSYRALQLTALSTVGSAMIDILVTFDFAETGGIYSGRIVAIANIIGLLVLGAAATVAGASQPAADESSEEPALSSQPTSDDAAVATALDELMQSRQPYRDVDLNLNRLARKMGLSVRQVSNAINRVKAMSVSQYVNDYRVKEACKLLAETDEAITRIMFDAGFQTKSNFNREFLRVTGMSPKAWRARHNPIDETNVIRLAG
ncbi:AraC family transcriptional regulator [Phyllobacterium sp. SB3]|uniref:helix-turn-helix domain-containing protein n=1 Tax=Phyllobacterium sp. SB3 TaxID=3156073 RepID=UPI0032AF867D